MLHHDHCVTTNQLLCMSCRGVWVACLSTEWWWQAKDGKLHASGRGTDRKHRRNKDGRGSRDRRQARIGH